MLGLMKGRGGMRLGLLLRSSVLLAVLCMSACMLWAHWQPWHRLLRTPGTVPAQASGAGVTRQSSLPFSKDGRRFIVSTESALQIWDTNTSRPIRELALDAEGARACVLSPEGDRVLQPTPDGDVVVWDVATGEQVHTVESQQGKIEAIHLCADGSRLAVFGFDTVRLWDMASYRAEGRLWTDVDLLGNRWVLVPKAISPNRSRILAHYRYYDFSFFKALDTRTGEQWRIHKPKDVPLHSEEDPWSMVALLPNPDLALGHDDRHWFVWSLLTRERVYEFPIRQPKSLDGPVFSPDGELVLFVIDPEITWPPGEHEGQLQTPGKVLVWDWGERRIRSALRGHSSYVDAASFSPDGARIVTHSTGVLGGVRDPGERRFRLRGDDSVRIWDSWSGDELAVIPVGDLSLKSVSFSPRGDLLLIGRKAIELYRRARPERWWGVLSMWLFWSTIALATALLWSSWHGLRVMIHAGQSGRVRQAK